MMRHLLLLGLVLATPAGAALGPAALDAVRLEPPANAALPLDVALSEDTRPTTLGEILRRHPVSVLVFADYTCRSVCGAELAIAAASLADHRLSDTDAGLVVVGLDPKDDAAAARRMKSGISAAGIGTRVAFLNADPNAVRRLAEAAGYRYRYDPATDQFAHPAAVLTVDADGRVGRALAGLSLMPETLRTALVEVGAGRVGGLAERVLLRCYAFDPATGLYTADATRWLRIAGAATLAAIGLLVLGLARRARRQAAQ